VVFSLGTWNLSVQGYPAKPELPPTETTKSTK